MYYFSSKKQEFEGIKSYGRDDLFELANILKEIKKNNALAKALGETNHTCIILDDVLHDKTFFKENYGRTLMYNGRCLGVTLIITIQYPFGISPECRSQIDHIMMANEDFMSNKKKLYNYYAGMFSTTEAFSSALDDTEYYQFMTVINKGRVKSIEDRIAYIKTYELSLETKISLLKDMTPIGDSDEESSDFDTFIIKNTNDFDKYLETSNIDINMSDTNKELRLQKINEIQYVTSMISYLNSKLNTLAGELKEL